MSQSDQKMKSQEDDLQQLKNNLNLNNFDLDKNKYFVTKFLNNPATKLSETSKEEDDENSKTLNPRPQHLPQSLISACQTACDINYNSLKLTVKKKQ